MSPLASTTERRAESFADRYRGTVAELDAASVAAAMGELEEIADFVKRRRLRRARLSVDTRSPEAGALMQRVQERSAQPRTTLLFFDLEWNPRRRRARRRAARRARAERWRHHLTTLRRYRPHQLSEPEEKILTETAVTGRSAFAAPVHRADLGDHGRAARRRPAGAADGGVGGAPDPDREARRAVAEGVTAALEPGLRTRAFVLNTLLADKATKDRLRSYEHWLASRNLANEASDESVAALIEAVVEHYELAGAGIGSRRGSARPARPLRPDGAGRRVRAANRLRGGARAGPRLLPRLLARARRGRGRSSGGDSPTRRPRPASGGAFCSYAVPSAHPYVMLYTSRPATCW